MTGAASRCKSRGAGCSTGSAVARGAVSDVEPTEGSVVGVAAVSP